MVLRSLFLLAVLFAPFAHADEEMERLKQGMPGPIVRFIDRAARCNHWLGEAPYDAERTREINKALSELGCSRLDADQEQLLKRYKGNAAVEHAIREGRQLSL